MFLEKRKDEIMQILRQQKSAAVNELAQRLYVSPITVRRDLSALERDGLVKRSHGGAVLLESISYEPSVYVRELENLKEKRAIAELCVKLIKPQSTLFMDSSSTVGTLIPYLSGISALSVITNGVKNALLLSQSTDAAVFVCGGAMNTNSNSLTGTDACEYLNRLNADICILSCSGCDITKGITEISVEQSRAKAAMLRNSRLCLLLCNSAKLGIIALSKTCELNAFDYLITDCKPSEQWLAFAAQCNCKVLYLE